MRDGEIVLYISSNWICETDQQVGFVIERFDVWMGMSYQELTIVIVRKFLLKNDPHIKVNKDYYFFFLN